MRLLRFLIIIIFAGSVYGSDIRTGGIVTTDGGAPVLERGVCWGLMVNPTISGSHSHDGSGLGQFETIISGLTPNTTYHVRAYATNSAGVGYGEDYAITTPALDFFPAISPTSLSVVKGTIAVYRVSFTAQGGFMGPVTLAVKNLPLGAVATFSKTSISLGEISTLSITTAKVGIGTYSGYIEASSGAVKKTVNFILTVKNKKK